MSRSYRKPYWTQGYGGVWRKLAKQLAARKVRHARIDLQDGAYFKKLYNSWDICDYKFHDTRPDKPWRVLRK